MCSLSRSRQLEEALHTTVRDAQLLGGAEPLIQLAELVTIEAAVSVRPHELADELQQLDGGQIAHLESQKRGASSAAVDEVEPDAPAASDALAESARALAQMEELNEQLAQERQASLESRQQVEVERQRCADAESRLEQLTNNLAAAEARAREAKADPNRLAVGTKCECRFSIGIKWLPATVSAFDETTGR